MHINLVLFKKNGSHKPFPLPSNITVIGRRHDCDICIPLQPVSRRHCKLCKNNNTVNIRDLDSRNGTFLNGKRIKEAPVTAGDYIGVGPLTFLLQVDGKPEEINPPQHFQQKIAPEAATPPRRPADDLSGSFTGLDLSDSFLHELKEL
jgi:pSer/pThr/pTyr-binding forkhead associated (FHA) protein